MVRVRVSRLLLAALLYGVSPIAGAALAQQPLAVAPVVHPELWPKPVKWLVQNPATERKIDALIDRMTVEEKVGQIIQPEMKSIKSEDVRTYHIGSIENGGGSVPGGNKHASAADWLSLIESYYDMSLVPSKNGLRIPMMWASDAVHGHNNVSGATLFPHNIGLGAARDPALIRRIGAATAQEVRAVGMDWSFAPTLAVVRDDRWGRTYESYSEDPRVVASYAREMVLGLQGQGKTFLDKDHVISTAKHFLGDGGTDGGRDQGDNLASEADLRDIHGAGYPAAVGAGVQAVMASFSSWHGIKMHANKALLTDVLKDRIGFDGLIIGDWNAHGQVPGCTKGNCAAAFNAGIDMFNVPEDWKELYGNLVRQVNDGTIPAARLNDAVRRILRVKLRAGVFDEARPSARLYAGNQAILGARAHRAIAREAVAKSLVLLKDDNKLLPLRPQETILVAGEGADNIMKQTGGWTLSWQGNDNTNADFPGATSIWTGISDAVRAAGGTPLLSPDGSFAKKPDAAIVVFGENPYAEFQGDQADVSLRTGSAASLALLKRLKAAGIPTVAVLLSGRALYLNQHINAADAFVAAWLPGSEGAGIADVLIARADGNPRRDFQGKLSFSWPKRPDQTPLNVGDVHYDPQFAFGYGLSYASRPHLGQLAEAVIDTRAAAPGVFLSDGVGTNGFALTIGDPQAPRIAAVASRVATYGSEALVLTRSDRRRQEDARLARWSGIADAWVELSSERPVDLSREANGAMALGIDLRSNQAAPAPIGIEVTGGGKSQSLPLVLAPTKDWQTVRIPLRCFAKVDLASITSLLRLRTSAPQTLGLSDIRLLEALPADRCPAP